MSKLNPPSLEKSWEQALASEWQKDYMKSLMSFLESERNQNKEILPPEQFRYNALNSTPLDNVKVVILGQDPYPTPGHAHGLCFSVLPDVKPIPKSLVNIYKELKEDVGVENESGNLQSWADQGVLLLNSVLTVASGTANSHQGKGWEQFTDKIISIINELDRSVIFVLWGAYAQKKGSVINESKHLVIRSPHPSPLAAYRGFWGSKPFSRVNKFLKGTGVSEIDWQV